MLRSHDWRDGVCLQQTLPRLRHTAWQTVTVDQTAAQQMAWTMGTHTQSRRAWMHGGRVLNSALLLKRSEVALRSQQLCAATRIDFWLSSCHLHSSVVSLILKCLFASALCTTVRLECHLLNLPTVTHDYAARHIVNALAAHESKWVRLLFLVCHPLASFIMLLAVAGSPTRGGASCCSHAAGVFQVHYWHSNSRQCPYQRQPRQQFKSVWKQAIGAPGDVP